MDSRIAVFAIGLLTGGGLVPQAQAAARYYFVVGEVKGAPDTDESTKVAARTTLIADLAGRGEFTADLGNAATEGAVVDELKRRKLRGFSVTLRIDELAKALKPPRPGGRLKQLAVRIKVSVFGSTLPGAKLAFSGEGEASIEAEVIEKRMDQEAAVAVQDVLVQAVKQAVDQAVAKLSAPRAMPMNETKSRGKRKKS